MYEAEPTTTAEAVVSPVVAEQQQAVEIEKELEAEFVV